MSDRVNWYFRQRVTEAELDLAFELLEKADRNLAADLGFVGILAGAVPTPHSPLADLSIDLTGPGRAYDGLGQRIFFGTGQTLDCSVDATGLSTEVPSPGQERWLGVFLKFERLLSDPRTDGNSQQIYFRRDESFQFVVRQGPPATAGEAQRVALQAGELLVCDVLRSNGQSQITADAIDISRRQVFVFAPADTVQALVAGWSTLAPTSDSVQGALDEVDAELTEHFAGTSRRHRASAIDIPAHGFVSGIHVEAALHELIDHLSSTTDGTPGAQKVGADAVTGTPHALAAGHVDGQLSQLVTWLNDHVGASSGAHQASAIAAATHNYITGSNVQSQLQEIVQDLASEVSPTQGAIRIGAVAVTGSPNQLSAGTVSAQLAALLSHINNHLNDTVAAHLASAIELTDAGGLLTASTVEGGVSELASALQADHYRGNESNAGQHRAIHQPYFGGSKALLWEAVGVGGTTARFRVHADANYIWFTVNAFWNGTTWERDNAITYSGGYRFSRNDFEFLHDNTGTSTFSNWSRVWRIPMSSTVNSAMETSGDIQETGRVGFEATNSYSATRTIALGATVTFRSRFPTTPSSVTLSTTTEGSAWGGTLPSVWLTDRDGFGYYRQVSTGAAVHQSWYGKYTAVA